MESSTEEFWKGEFGEAYRERNENLANNNFHLFAEILNGICSESILELGANTGQNIMALHTLYPDSLLTSVEINQRAAQEIPYGEVWIGSLFDCKPHLNPHELVLSKGVGIHIPPDKIEEYYSIVYNLSSKYILFCEYYNPTPVEIPYRGYQGKLWKRDFAGDMLDRYPDVVLKDCGFAYHRSEYPQDDITWFLLEKMQ